MSIAIGEQIQVGGIKVPDIDANYGPFASREDAFARLGTTGRNVITVGLTVGIREGDRIVEYWWQGGTALENLIMKSSTIIVDLKTLTGNTIPDTCYKCLFTYGDAPVYSIPCLFNSANCLLVYVDVIEDEEPVQEAYIITGRTIVAHYTGENIPQWVQRLQPSNIATEINSLDTRTRWK